MLTIFLWAIFNKAKLVLRSMNEQELQKHLTRLKFYRDEKLRRLRAEVDAAWEDYHRKQNKLMNAYYIGTEYEPESL